MNLPSSALSLLALATLAACAGGSAINEPLTAAPIPVLRAVDTTSPNVVADTSTDREQRTFATQGGSVKPFTITKPSPYIPGLMQTNQEILYQAPDGKYYDFGTYNTLIMPSSSTSARVLPNSHPMQPLDSGGKMIACCTNQTSTGMNALRLKSMQFGAWMSPSKTVSLFAGGTPAPTDTLQGVDTAGRPTGKATYEVIGLRVKNDRAVTSSYETRYSPYNTGQVVTGSFLTVNFNTGKLGGTIIGNADFGDSIEMRDVNVNGNQFSGTASSGGHTGQVSGGLFAKEERFYSGTLEHPSGGEIGGTVNFGSNSPLNASFGGTRREYNAADTSTDTSHLVSP